MNYPSIKRIASVLNIDQSLAKQIRGLMDGDLSPQDVPTTKQGVDGCYGVPYSDEQVMHAIDRLLGNHGVEGLGEALGSYYGDAPQYSYSNTGDTYAGTVIQDNETGRYLLTSWGDLVESGKVRTEE